MRTKRKLWPEEAVIAVAPYLPADPALWLERCALAGITVRLTSDGRLVSFNVYGPNCEHTVDQDQRGFLQSWLNLTPGGHDAVFALLHKCGATV